MAKDQLSILQGMLIDNIITQFSPNNINQQQAQPQQPQIDPINMMMGQMLSQGPNVNLPTGAALTGLSPEHLSNALAMKFNQDQVMQQKPAQLMEMMYKGAMIDEARSRVNDPYKRIGTIAGAIDSLAQAQGRGQKVDPGMMPYPIPYPGMEGKITTDEWNALPTEGKLYAMDMAQRKMSGKDKDISMNEWMADRVVQEKLAFYKGLEGDPAKLAIALRLEAAKAGGRQEVETGADIDEMLTKTIPEAITASMAMDAGGMDYYVFLGQKKEDPAYAKNPESAEKKARVDWTTRQYIKHLSTIGTPGKPSISKDKKFVVIPFTDNQGKSREVKFPIQ